MRHWAHQHEFVIEVKFDLMGVLELRMVNFHPAQRLLQLNLIKTLKYILRIINIEYILIFIKKSKEFARFWELHNSRIHIFQDELPLHFEAFTLFDAE